MKTFCTIVFAAAIIALAGCSSNPAQVAPPVNAAQNHAAQYQTNSRGWMLSRAQNMNLLYVSDQDAPGKLLAFSYPQGELVGEVTVPSDYPGGLCSDSVGDVFVTTFGPYSQSYVYEYAHGGTEPIATLVDPGDSNGCAIDPKTGNLAVTNPPAAAVRATMVTSQSTKVLRARPRPTLTIKSSITTIVRMMTKATFS